MKPEVIPQIDRATSTVSYVVIDPVTRATALVDSILDFDPKSGRTSTASADRMVTLVRGRGLKVEWILETHVDVGHRSAAPYLKEKVGGRVGSGEYVHEVQKIFRDLFNTEPGFVAGGYPFTYLFTDGERFRLGQLEVQAIRTPGHSPTAMTCLIGDAAFVDDTLFQPDYATACADFPGRDAHALYRSIRCILDLDPETRAFTGHDRKAPGRQDDAWESTGPEQRTSGINVQDGVSEGDLVALRTARHAKLDLPITAVGSVPVSSAAFGMVHGLRRG